METVALAQEAGAIVSLSGFGWADVEWRFLAFDGTHYGYGPTPEDAAAGFLDARSVR